MGNLVVEIIYGLMIVNNPELLNVTAVENDNYIKILIIKNTEQGRELNKELLNEQKRNK